MNTRKLSGSVKRIIGLFSGLVVVLGAVFGFAVYNSISNTNESVPVSVESTVYDVNGNKIVLDNPASVYKSNLGDWRLIDSNSKTYSLGENAVIYDSGSLKLFGGGYQVISDTDVSLLTDYSQIDDINYPGFFKLADRKYLITGSNIGGEGYPVSTDGYLFIVMDKTGNAMLLNDEVCEKTTSASAISVDGEFIFDIANELLTYGEDKVVDCSAIIGSSNEYDPDNDPTAIREKINSLKEQGKDIKNPDEMLIDAKGGTGGRGGNGGQGGDGGLGGTGGSGGPGGQGGTGIAPDVINARKTLNLYKITPSYTQAEIEYYVNDPYGLLGEITITYTNMNDSNDKKTITCDIDANKMVLYNLAPSTKYMLELNASKDDSKKSYQYFYTLDPEVLLSVVKATEESVICNVKYNYGLSLGSAQLVLSEIENAGKVDDNGNPSDYLSIMDISSIGASGDNGQNIIITNSGQNNSGSVIDFANKGKYLALWIANAKYAGNKVNIPTRFYFTNVIAGKGKWDAWVEKYGECLKYNSILDDSGDNFISCPKNDDNKKIVQGAIEEYKKSITDKSGRETGFTDWDTTNVIETLEAIVTKYGWN